MKLEEIKTETLKDNTLQQVSAHVRNNSWHTVTDKIPNAAALRQYRLSRELTLSASEDLILRGCRIVIPLSAKSQLFSALGPQWWNKLLPDVRIAESLTSFRRRLQTHLFRVHLDSP